MSKMPGIYGERSWAMLKWRAEIVLPMYWKNRHWLHKRWFGLVWLYKMLW